MSGSIEEFRKELRRTWRVRNSVDWSKPGYSLDKLFICSVFSKIAYLHVTDHELAHHERATLVPCETFQDLVTKRQKLDVASFLKPEDLPGASVVPSDRIVAVAVPRRDVIFVALRGTVQTHAADWWADLKAVKTSMYDGIARLELHSGFFEAADAFFEPLGARVAELVATFDSP